MSRRQHRARKLLERDVEIPEGEPIGASVSWRIPGVTASTK